MCRARHTTCHFSGRKKAAPLSSALCLWRKKRQSEMCNQMLSDEPKNDKKFYLQTGRRERIMNLSVTEKAKLCSDDG